MSGEDDSKKKSSAGGAGSALAIGAIAVVGLAAYGVYSIIKSATGKGEKDT